LKLNFIFIFNSIRTYPMRKLLLKVHLILGLACGVFIVVLGLSGSVLLYRADLERAMFPQLSAQQPAGEVSALHAIVQEYRAAHPDANIRSISLPQAGSRDALQLVVAAKGGAKRVYLDPATGRELGERLPNSDWLALLVDLHHNLFADSHFYTGLVGAGFTLMCISGIIVWWPAAGLLRSPAFAVRRGMNAREAHHFFGFWSFVVLLVIAFTGTVFTWRDAYNNVASWMSRQPKPAVRVKIEGNATGLDLDRALLAAKAAIPGAQPTLLRPATKDGEPLIVRMRAGSDLRPSGSNQVFLGANGEVVKVDKLADKAFAFRAVDAFVPIHFAEAGGLPMKLLWTVAGFVPTILFFSGLRIWWRSLRRRNRDLNSQPVAAAS
jgi:uncharacterized iron-regulated membrane protein